jgi:peptidoglycan L-alanyl-D-glutamate endopeptidase CwlK
MHILGQQSEQRLSGLNAGLVRCVRRAISTCSVDFSVFEGMRTLERQNALVAQGVSRTLDSYHLTGHAVDLVPYIGGRLQWQAPACVQVAIAMREAAIHFDVNITWGAVWDRQLRALDPAQLIGEIESYVVRYSRSRGGDSRPLIDYPHFQVRR